MGSSQVKDLEKLTSVCHICYTDFQLHLPLQLCLIVLKYYSLDLWRKCQVVLRHRNKIYKEQTLYYIDRSENNASYLFPWELQHMKSTITLFDRASSELKNTVFWHSHHHWLCIFTSDEQHKHLHQQRWPTVTVTIAETQHPPPHCVDTHWLVFINLQQALMNVSGCNFFPHEGIQLHTFASDALPC